MRRGPRPVVVDREEDDVALANDLPDIGLVAGLVDRLTGDPGVACDPGQGLGLVRAHVTPRAVARGADALDVGILSRIYSQGGPFKLRKFAADVSWAAPTTRSTR